MKLTSDDASLGRKDVAAVTVPLSICANVYALMTVGPKTYEIKE